jgi:ribosomal protein S18 acetylase RimI-like enzyme
VIADTTVRLATRADAAKIAAMSRDYIEHGLPWSWTAARVAAAIRDPDVNVVVAGASGAIAAFGIMSYRNDEAHLLLLAVHPSSQRRGVGSTVVRWLEEVARTAGAKRVLVECRRENVAARNFYGDHCYHERDIARGMYRGIEDGVRLTKWLR